jgi:hypothetical protein
MSRARVGFVEDRELGLQHRQLENLVALFFAAAEPLVDAALQQAVIKVQDRELRADELQELHGVEFGFAARLALRIERRTQEVRVVHARDLDRILERKEQAGRGAFFRLEGKQVPAFELHGTGGDFVAIASGKYIAERRLAGAVGTHDRVHFTGLHRERKTLEDLAAGDSGMEVVDLQHLIPVSFDPAPLAGGVWRWRFASTSTHRTFEADFQQLLGFHREFHRQLAEHLLAESVDDQRHRVFLGDATRAAIEQLVVRNLGRGRFVLDRRTGMLDLDVRERMRAALLSDQQRVALRVIARAPRHCVRP